MQARHCSIGAAAGAPPLSHSFFARSFVRHKTLILIANASARHHSGITTAGESLQERTARVIYFTFSVPNHAERPPSPSPHACRQVAADRRSLCTRWCAGRCSPSASTRLRSLREGICAWPTPWSACCCGRCASRTFCHECALRRPNAACQYSLFRYGADGVKEFPEPVSSLKVHKLLCKGSACFV